MSDHVADLVDDYVHDLLDAGRAAEVGRHCKACPACNEALDDARRRLAALHTAPAAEAPEQLVHDTMRKVDAYQKARTLRLRRFVWAVGGALAASALILAWLHVYYSNLTATPYDLVVLGQRELLAATNGSVRVVLRDVNTLAPIAGVPVSVQLVDHKHNQTADLASFATDADGSGRPRFTLPDWADDSYELRVVARTPGASETVSQSVALRREFKVMLSSDKPVYQPGQTIHARALSLRRPDLHPMADQPTTFSVVDPRGNIVFKQEGKTSRYGIAAADCPVDSEIAEGAYVVLCKAGEVESRLSVDVKKYVLPKFKVTATPDRPFYKNDDTIRLTVQADYFFGKPVADADVEVDVTRDALLMRLDHFKGRTDAKGAASFEYVVKFPDDGRSPPSAAGPAHVQFQVTVTDLAGQKQTASAAPAVSEWPARIDVIPEAGEVVQGVPNRVYVLVTRLDGTPAGAVHVALMDYTNKDPKDAVHADMAVADDNGAAAFEVTPPERWGTQGWQVVLEIIASDDKGVPIARRDLAVPGVPVGDFLVRTDKAVYRGGDTMTVSALGGPGPVFVDLIQGGQTLRTETIEMADGQGQAAVDLPPELAGTVQVVGYRVDAKGYPDRKTRVVYVRPADQVHIAATLEPGRKAYKPGERPMLHLKLTDRDGKPCPGAVSLAGVDEAVFSVLPQRPGTERAFYTVEEDLMAPVYRLRAWSPDDAGSERFEEALFAAASHTDAAASRGDEVTLGIRHLPPLIDEMTPPSAQAPTHSLTAQTYQAKADAAESLRADRLIAVKWGWVMLVIAVIAAAVLAFWLFAQMTALVKSLVTGYIVLPFLLFSVVAFAGKDFGPMGVAAAKVLPPAQAARDKYGALSAGALPANEPVLIADLAADDRDFSFDVAGVVMSALKQGRGEAPPPRIREMFPETLLWRPELITDDAGEATLPLDLADSITTWRLSASAVSGDGKLGAMQMPVKVFQDFFVDLNLPVALTRGDEVGVPVVVYNYLDKPQTVTLTLADAPEKWFTQLDGAEQRLELQPNEVRSVRYRIKVEKVGDWTLTVAARGAADADAVKRSIEVVPDGRRVEQVVNGTLEKPADVSLTLPEGAIPGSAKVFVKIYPSNFSQLVEGLDNIFRMPSGCFEQTSSTTYPNILALDYLQRTHQSAPAVEAKAHQLIRTGAQRLFGFEVPGGGFDWFGRAPANRTLTAYGLMEFQDMDRVETVDPRVIARTRAWLLAQRRPDGSWDPEAHRMYDDAVGAGRQSDDARLAETAYIAWAVFGDPAASAEASRTFAYLKSRNPETISDPHTLALVCNALLSVDAQNADAAPYLDRLESVKRFGADGKFAWWEQPAGARTTFYGAGRSANVETTALATLALVRGGRNPDTARKALAWLVAQKDPNGTWYSTQATVQALKALLAGTDKPLGGDGERLVEVRLDGEVIDAIQVPAGQADVLKQLDLSAHLKPGKQTLTVSEAHGAAIGFQASFRYNEPDAGPAAAKAPLAVELKYDRTELALGEQVQATAQVTNRTDRGAPMVMVELPVPPGFVASADDFTAAMKADAAIAKFQLRGRDVLLYLTGLEPSHSVKLTYRLRATMPVKAASAGARAYEYYDPDQQGSSAGTRFTVEGRD